MPLPDDVIAAQERMKEAQTALLAYAESDERNSVEHRRLGENLQEAIREYDDRIAALLRNIGANH